MNSKHSSFSFFSRIRKSIERRLEESRDRLRIKKIRKKLNRQIKSGEIFVDICNRLGIGARLIWCLEILMFCEENNIKASFKFSYIDHPENKNYFSLYFLGKDNADIDWISIFTISELGFEKNYNKLLTVKKSNQLILQHLHFRPEIIAELNDFLTSRLPPRFYAVHFRNTDKLREATPVPYSEVLANMMKLADKIPGLRFFIATDDQEFLEYMMRSSLADRIVYREDSYRSTDQSAIHENPGLDRFLMNKDALINMLIMSKSDFIIKTSSILSSFSILCNPGIHFCILNAPYENKLWFPESELQNYVNKIPD